MRNRAPGLVVVTGARGGLGAALASRFAATGWRVVGTSRQLPEAPGEWRVLELGNPEAVERFLADQAELVAQADVWINNAGAGCFGAFADWKPADVRAQLEVMLAGPVRLSHAVFGAMARRGHGCLVNVSSLSVEFPLPYQPLYNVAKAGLSQLSQTLLLEAPPDVQIIDFQPGDFRTGFNAHTTRIGSGDARQARVWQRLEHHLQAGPTPEAIADVLVAAIRRGHRGRLRAGTFFQRCLAPLGASLLPGAWRRRAHLAYYGVGGVDA